MVRQAMEEIMARHNTAFLNSFWQMMENQVLLLMANHLVKMQVLSRLSKVWVFSQLNMWVVNRSNRTLIKQYLIHTHMVRWLSVLLEFNLSLLTG
jgi:hypothetical protein